MWRYKRLLPSVSPLVTLGEGWTSLVSASESFAGEDTDLYFKLEFLNPTCSFKDRGAAVVVAKAKEWGAHRIADDSSGNAGAALAGYSARAKMKCRIYVPADASGGKIAQIRAYGARLEKVEGPRARATERAKEDCHREGIYYGSHNLSPYYQLGMKTIAYEVAEQLEWNSPGHVVLPVGGGTLITGIYRGFMDLYRLDWIQSIPRIHAVQSQACNPVTEALREGRSYIEKVTPKPTVAEGVHIGNPGRAKEVISTVRDANGKGVTVAEEDIVDAHSKLASEEGIFCEPTSAVALAGLTKLIKRGIVGHKQTTVVPLTGCGLKDLDSLQ